MWHVIGIAVFGVILLTGQLWAADVPPDAPAASLGDAVRSGKLIFNLRPRYEFVDQDGKPDDANVYTLRTLAGWKSSNWKGLSGTIELIDVSRLDDDYNDGRNGKVNYPVVADPDNTNVNQLFLEWTGLPATNIRAGRQLIKLDNTRFVGNVEFRQMMQVFNGITFENTSLRNTRLYAGYLTRLKTVDARQHDTDTVLLNARYAYSPSESLVGYGYFQDQTDAIVAGGFSGPAPTDTSNQIVGVRADGAHPLSDKWKLLYTGEYAKQNDYSGGDGRIDAHYMRLGLGGQLGNYSLRVDQELLSSNDGLYAFQMPLGTNHLFQGWADQFLITPRQGLRDTFLSASAKVSKAHLLAEYHQFESDTGGIDFGDEIDVGVSYPLMEKLIGKIEYADYKAGDATSGKVDTRKFWLTLIFNY